MFKVIMVAVAALLFSSPAFAQHQHHHHSHRSHTNHQTVLLTGQQVAGGIGTFFNQLFALPANVERAVLVPVPRNVNRAVRNVEALVSGPGQIVRATWYGEEMLRRGHSGHTACGQVFHPGGYTMAHRSLPCGTRVMVTGPAGSHVFTVNDRGANWDLARGGAWAIGVRSTSRVRVQLL